MKIRKVKKQKDYLSVAIFTFVVAIGLSLYTNLVIGCKIVSLKYEIQTNQNKIQQLKDENDKITIQISDLENKERIYTIAQENGLTMDQENVLWVK